ncbi:hypothetical protein [Silvimonas iriomotensis]|uniref:Uncharacterized protein n=1 Tax=Silvimonas iriomotensis TaxID=449662 RepID=A0ABQ2P8G3_9NEIS|nr:hypothetical protein [Silvimonas iriomotensis]GGP20554.1 hypothetical protein GCM10010970_15790 [Silvimonas iriomotensis]
MSPENTIKLLTALAWPCVTLIIAAVFYKSISGLLTQLANTLTFKKVTIKVLGIEAELSPEYARTVLDELLNDIAETSNQLTVEEIALFDKILKSGGSSTVIELAPGFVRDHTVEHKHLQHLRDHKLILPIEGGPWKDEKHPLVTPYGQLVAKLRNGRYKTSV